MTDQTTDTQKNIPLIKLSTIQDENSTILFTGWIKSLNMVIDNMNSLMMDDYIKSGNLINENKQIGIIVDTLTVKGDAFTKYIQFKDSTISDNIGVSQRYAYKHIHNTIDGTEGDAQFPKYNPHGDSTAILGLDKVDNTAFKDKPLSKDTEIAITELEDTVEKMHVFDDTVRQDGELAVRVSGIKKFFDSLFVPFCDSAYPVGSYYRNAENNNNPNEIFGIGEWIKIDSGVTLITAGDDYPVDSTGGSYTVTLTPDHIFLHTHTTTIDTTDGTHTHGRGNMNFTAEFWGSKLGSNNSLSANGAFSPSSPTGGGGGAKKAENNNVIINLDASRHWTGSTSSNGIHAHTFTLNDNVSETTPIDIVQPYIVVNTWRRIK